MRIGLTGGIGSGKTTVCRLFAEQGVPIIDADLIAHQLVVPGTEALQHIVDLFGEQILSVDGELDRGALRAAVFSDETSRFALEAILHPRIRQAMNDAARQQTSPYCILAIPLLLETGQQTSVDRILVVDTSEELQISRVLSRDHRTEEETRRIIASQISRQQRLKAADDIIHNSSDSNSLARQVAALHQHYLMISTAK